jgi:CHAT domain-containing protein
VASLCLVRVSAWAAGADDVDLLLLTGDYEEAERQCRLAVERSDGADAVAAASAGSRLARALAFNGRMADGEAERLASAAVEAHTRILGEGHPETARSLATLGAVQLRMGQAEAAATTLTRALAGLRGCGADCDSRRVEALALLAEADSSLARFEQALLDVEEGLATLPSDGTARRVLQARLLDRRAEALLYKGDVAAGHAAALSALAMRAALSRPHPDSVFSCIVLGDADNMAGGLEESAQHNRDGLQTARLTLRPGHPLRALATSRLASREAAAGAFTVAFDLHREALEASRESLGPEHPQLIDHLTDFGNAYQYAGDLAEAASYYESALALAERVRGATSLAAATLAYNLALAYGAAERWEDAEASLRRALDIWRAVHGDDHIHVARALAEWASLLSRAGRDEEALATYERAQSLRIRLSGPDHPALAQIHTGLAELLARCRRRREAEAHAARAAALLLNRPGGELARAHALALQARLVAAGPRWRSALPLATESERRLRDHIRRNVRFLGERQALTYVDRDFEGRDVLLSMATTPTAPATAGRDALEAVVGSRNLVLDEMARRRADARMVLSPTIAEAWSRLAAARGRLATLIYRGVEGDDPLREQMLQQAEAEADTLERQAALVDAHVRQRDDVQGSWVEALRRALPARAVLVSFVRYSRTQVTGAGPEAPGVTTPHYVALLLRQAGGAVLVIPLGAAGEIDALVEHWQAALEARLWSPLDAEAARRELRTGLALASRVWTPIERHLAGASLALLVPDGMLLVVNFAALPSDSRRYVVEQGPTLHLLSAERDLLAPTLPGGGQASMLVVAQPAFDSIAALHRPTAVDEARSGPAPEAPVAGARLRSAKWECDRPDSLRWDPLPAAGLEARDIESLWTRAGGSTRVLTGSLATEQAVKQLASGYDVLHIASHGFRLGSDCHSSLQGLEQGHHASGPRRTSPLLNIGLPLAGANQRQNAASEDDDGILTAEEVASLDLARTRLVVLSACDTGRGRLQDGEGVLGLRRAFAIAGARAVVMSLGPVDDSRARQWMQAFYEARLDRHLGTAAAVRAASLVMLDRLRTEGARRPSPMHWAAFLATGDWR